MTDDRLARAAELRRADPFLPIAHIARQLHMCRTRVTAAIVEAGLPIGVGRMRGKHAADAKVVDERWLDEGDLLHALIEHHPYGCGEPPV